MKKAMAAFCAVGLALVAVSAAVARSSGGVRAHTTPPPAIAHFYSGRGYWDGHRYWARRMRWHGEWRYGN